MYLLLIDSFSISGKSYPLSRHRFCFFNDLSTTTLSSVSVCCSNDVKRVIADRALSGQAFGTDPEIVFTNPEIRLVIFATL
jgi:hypothetical protein